MALASVKLSANVEDLFVDVASRVHDNVDGVEKLVRLESVAHFVVAQSSFALADREVVLLDQTCETDRDVVSERG